MIDTLLFNRISKISQKIKKQDKNLYIIANESINLVKAHPEYLAIFKTKNNVLFKKLILNISKAIYIIFLGLFRTLTFNNKGVKAKSDEYDILLISHMISPKQKKGDDLYFKGISEILDKKKIKYLKIYINNLGLRYTNKNFFDHKDKKNLAISSSIDFFTIISLYLVLFKNFFKFLIMSYQHNRNDRKIYKVFAVEFLSLSTLNNLIFKKKFENFFLNCKFKNLAITFEGFSWEKIICFSCKKVNPEAKIIGYQFAGLTKTQKIKNNDLNKIFFPDLVWTNGEINKRRLSKNFNRVLNIGSDRCLKNNNKVLIKKRINNCLVIPEGFSSECKIILNFSLMCANKFPQIKFIWRFHPTINLDSVLHKIIDKDKFPKNIIISKKKLIKDIYRSSFFLYRGSTSAITALQNGLYPIYLNLNHSVNVDPIYDFKVWKTEINTFDNFKIFVNKKLDKVFYQKKLRISGINFSKKYFMKLNKEKIYSSLDL